MPTTIRVAALFASSIWSERYWPQREYHNYLADDGTAIAYCCSQWMMPMPVWWNVQNVVEYHSREYSPATIDLTMINWDCPVLAATNSNCLVSCLVVMLTIGAHRTRTHRPIDNFAAMNGSTVVTHNSLEPVVLAYRTFPNRTLLRYFGMGFRCDAATMAINRTNRRHRTFAEWLPTSECRRRNEKKRQNE